MRETSPEPASLYQNSTGTQLANEDSAHEFMNSGAPWVTYVNEVVFRDFKPAGISIDANYRINTGSLSALELLELFKESGWSWPMRWYRRNRNPDHPGGIHLEKELENDRWLHLIVIPERTEPILESGGNGVPEVADNWNVPPRRIDLHAENLWLQPSSAAHFCDFIKQHYILPFFRRFV